MAVNRLISCRYKTRVYFAWALRELKNDFGFSIDVLQFLHVVVNTVLN
jgi:hypothetical protein